MSLSRRWIGATFASTWLAVLIAGGCGARTPLDSAEATADGSVEIDQASPPPDGSQLDGSCRRECDGAIAPVDGGARDVSARDVAIDTGADCGPAQCCAASGCGQAGSACTTSAECCAGNCMGGICQPPTTCTQTACFAPSHYCETVVGGAPLPHFPMDGCMTVPSDCLSPCPTQATCDCIAKHHPCDPAAFSCTVHGLRIEVVCAVP